MAVLSGLYEYAILDETLLKFICKCCIEQLMMLCNFQGTYLHHKEIKAAQGIKITGQVIHHNYKSRNIIFFPIKKYEFWLRHVLVISK